MCMTRVLSSGGGRGEASHQNFKLPPCVLLWLYCSCDCSDLLPPQTKITTTCIFVTNTHVHVVTVVLFCLNHYRFYSACIIIHSFIQWLLKITLTVNSHDLCFLVMPCRLWTQRWPVYVGDCVWPTYPVDSGAGSYLVSSSTSRGLVWLTARVTLWGIT